MLFPIEMKVRIAIVCVKQSVARVLKNRSEEGFEMPCTFMYAEDLSLRDPIDRVLSGLDSNVRVGPIIVADIVMERHSSMIERPAPVMNWIVPVHCRGRLRDSDNLRWCRLTGSDDAQSLAIVSRLRMELDMVGDNWTSYSLDVARHFVGKSFKASDVRRVLDAFRVQNVIDMHNFRNNFVRRSDIRDTGRLASTATRPAPLYRYRGPSGVDKWDDLV